MPFSLSHVILITWFISLWHCSFSFHSPSSIKQVAVPDFKSSALFEQIKASLDGMSPADRAATVKKVNGVFHMVVKNAAGAENTWTLELKSQGTVALGPQGKADITINLADDVFLDLASGKLNGQKAFMQGKVSAWSWNCDL
jgi:3-hydroxyacyl-CoA dehydrogenase/3a,7a,12a-trihydroxy-5b-cholest-24-enoyl-CoA hydratase